MMLVRSCSWLFLAGGVALNSCDASSDGTLRSSTPAPTSTGAQQAAHTSSRPADTAHGFSDASPGNDASDSVDASPIPIVVSSTDARASTVVASGDGGDARLDTGRSLIDAGPAVEAGSSPQQQDGGTGSQQDSGKVSPAPATNMARPSWNTGRGFYVASGKIFDANGVEFRIRGVNTVHWWASTSNEAIASVGRAHANTARAVFGPGAGAQTPELRQAIVEQYLAAGVVPMVDYHNGTCETDPALVNAAVDLWLGPDKAWLQKHEQSVMLNITNEWGPDSVIWRDTYVSAITRLRQGGVNNLVVIDAGGNCGQNAHSLETWAKDIFAADPQKNVVFSIHMYGFWHNPGASDVGKWDGQQPYDLDAELKRLLATGLPIIVGEFTTEAFSDVGYTARIALSTYEKNGVGWLAWDWANPADNRSNVVKSDVYNSSADLTSFGQLVVSDPTLGLLANARKATIF